MKKSIMNYVTPEIEVFAVAAEQGYANSTMLPYYLIEEDELFF